MATKTNGEATINKELYLVKLNKKITISKWLVEEISDVFRKNIKVRANGLNVRIISDDEEYSNTIAEIIRQVLRINRENEIINFSIPFNKASFAEKISGFDILIIVKKGKLGKLEELKCEKSVLSTKSKIKFEPME